jgi:hypothetical protein
VSFEFVERAVMAAENAARAALLENGIEPTGLMLNVAFDHGDGQFCVASKTPDPVPPFLAASLYRSAQEAGLTASEML